MVKKKGASTEKSRVPENSSDESISMLNDRILFLKKELLEKQKELEAKDQVLQAQIEELRSKNEEIENRAKERKRAEEAVKFANTYNRSLIEASLDPLVTISPDGVITDVNKATEAVTGYSRDKLIGTDFSNYFTDPEKAKEGYLTVFKQGSVKDYPLEIRRRDGHLTPVIYNASIYRDESGKVVGVFAAARDITERKRAEEAIKLANAYNRSLIEVSLDPLVTISPDGRITDVNKATEKVTGLSRDQLIGTDFSNYFTNPEKAREGYLKAFKAGSVTDYPLEIMHKDGHVTPVIYNASVYRNEAGDVIGVFAAARDITEQKKIEEARSRLAAIVNSSDDAIIGKTLDGVITSWNAGAMRLYGYKEEEAVGKSISILATPDYPEEIPHILNKIRCEEHIDHYETIRKRKDGRIINVSLSVSPIKDSNGRLVGASTITRDITEKKRTEEAIRLAGAYNRSLIEASLDPLVTISPDGVITDVNKATEAVTGYSRDKLIGTDFSIYFTEPEKAKEGYLTVYKLGSITDYPLEIRRRDGNITPVIYNASVYRDESGKVIGVFAAARNITERKKAEKALLKSRAILARAQDIAHVGNWAWNLKTNSIQWSDEIFKIFGYKPQELNPTYEWLLTRIFPDDRELFTKSVNAAVHENKLFNIDYRIIMPDGSIHYINIVADRIKKDIAGAPEWMYGIIQDITGRMQAEKALVKSRAILSRAQDIAHVGNWAWNLKTNSIQWSDEIFKIFGYKPQELQPTYEWLLTRIFPDDRELLTRSVSAAVHENMLFNIDYRIIMPDGSIHCINSVADRIKKDIAGDPEWMYGIIQDITCRKKVENELRDAREQAELYVDLMGHDINNMNMVALGFLEMACNKLELEGKLDRNDKMLITKPAENLENSSRLIDNVRKLQREKAGELKMKAIDVGEVLSSVKDQYLAVPDRDVKINLNATCRCTVMANELLRDVFSNLVGNAVKHSSGALTINIDMSCPQEGDMRFCKVVVEDNGPGIPDALKAAIFRRSHVGKKWHGRGLGLYLVNTLVGDFHGTVWVEDRVPGDYTKGARFVVMLPALK